MLMIATFISCMKVQKTKESKSERDGKEMYGGIALDF